MRNVRCLILVLSLVLIISSFAGCGSSKTPQTTTGFTEVMETAGFEVQDATETTDTNDLATAVLIAVGEDYQIEFYKLLDEETGESVFYNMQTSYESEYSIKIGTTEIFTNTYNYYAFSSGDNFYLMSRINDTLVFCSADKEYKSEIVEHIKTLGYK